MAIELEHLKNIIKIASQPPTPGMQAMAAAAQAAKPPGSPPLPKPIDEQDPAGDALSAEKQEMDKDKLESQRREELAKKDKEILSLQGQLQESQIEHERASAQAAVEQERNKAQQQLAAEKQKFDAHMRQQQSKLDQSRAAEQEKLNQQKVLSQAKEIEHSANLEKETAKQQVTIAQDKAKAMSDIAANEAQRYVKTTDAARSNADKYFAERTAKMDEQRSGVSPALKNQMTGAIKAMSEVGRMGRKAQLLPEPGAAPIKKMAATVQQPKPNTPESTTPPSTTPPPKAPQPAAPPQPQQPKQPNQPPQPQQPPQPAQTKAPAQPTQAAVPQPGAAPQMRQLQANSTNKNISNQLQGWVDSVNYGGLTGNAIGIAELQNKREEFMATGNWHGAQEMDKHIKSRQTRYEENQRLNAKAVEDMKALPQTGQLTPEQQKIKERGEAAQREAGAHTAATTANQKWSDTMAGRFMTKGVFGFFGNNPYADSKYSAVDQVRNRYKSEQWQKENGNSFAARANNFMGNYNYAGKLGNWAIGSSIDAIGDWRRTKNIADQYGVNRTWFGANEGAHENVQAADTTFNEYGLSSNPWADLGRTVEAPLTIAATAATLGTAGAGLAAARGAAGAAQAGLAATNGARAVGMGARAINAARSLQGVRGYNSIANVGRNLANYGQRYAKLTSNGWGKGLSYGVEGGALGQAFLPTHEGQNLGAGAAYNAIANQNSTPSVYSLDKQASQPQTPQPQYSGGPTTAYTSQYVRQMQQGYDNQYTTGNRFTDPYDKTGLGKVMDFASPFVSSLTGGAVKLKKDYAVPYAKHTVMDPAMAASNAAMYAQNTQADTRFRPNYIRSGLMQTMQDRLQQPVQASQYNFNQVPSAPMR